MKKPQIYSEGEKTLSNKWCWENRKVTCKRRSQTAICNHTPWIKTLNIRPEAINYIEENIDCMDLGLMQDFMNLTSKAREVKAKINE